MPVATRKLETERKELKSLEGGYVELRQLSYDEMLERRDGATKMLMERGANNADSRMAVQIANKWSNYYTFPKCIVDHNLTDENGVPLDFKKPDAVFKVLDPRVGAEIESYIDAMNQEEEPPADFTPPQNGSSLEEKIEPNELSMGT